MADRAAQTRDQRDHGQRGQALAELALVVTIILVMAVAVFDLGLGFYNSTLIVQGARDGARVAMDCGSTIGEIDAAARAAAPAGTVTVTIAPNPRPACPANNSSDAATTVTVSFTHTWILPFWGGGNSVTMAETATSR